MRVIAGEYRGRRLDAPPGETTRPTYDRVRENAFNLIGPLDGATVLDLFAGSGAMGIEALSRGAESCTFVENDRVACRTIDANLERFGLHALVLRQDVMRMLAGEHRRYDLILCDPPYDFPNHERLAALIPPRLADAGLLVYETSSRVEPEIEALNIRTSRKYGSARLTLFEP